LSIGIDDSQRAFSRSAVVSKCGIAYIRVVQGSVQLPESAQSETAMESS
jgi:hypothetical protein